MTDIVERLRNEVPCISDIGCANELCGEAADEIERLRKEVQVWINHTKTAVWSDSEECKFLTAENAKLRAALEELYSMCQRQDDFNDDRDGLTLSRALAALGERR